MCFYLENFQNLISFLLRHNGIIIETTELSLKPKSINISWVKVLLFICHHITCTPKLDR